MYFLNKNKFTIVSIFFLILRLLLRIKSVAVCVKLCMVCVHMEWIFDWILILWSNQLFYLHYYEVDACYEKNNERLKFNAKLKKAAIV